VGLRSFLQQTADDCNTVRANLNEVILAQTYQDLTGQIIRGVVALVGEVEHVLAELMRLTGPLGSDVTSKPGRDAEQVGHGFGPAIPGVSTGVVQGQEDIDALMAGLGL
jgi:chemotaxis protein CheZ